MAYYPATPIKDGSAATLATVKSDGTNNAVVVTQNAVPTTTVTATNLDIRDLTSVSDSVEVKQATNANLKADVTSNAQNIATETTASAIETNQTDGTQKTQIVDASGNVIGSDVHNGTYHLLTDTEDKSITGTITTLGGSVELSVHGSGSAIVLIGGTWSGKLDVQGSIDSTWVTLSIIQPTGQLIRTGINNDAQNGSYRVAIVSGYTKIRVVSTAFTSGSVSVKINASNVVGSNFVFQLNQNNLLASVYQPTATNLNANVTSNGANLATETTLSAVNNKLVSGTDIGDVTINNGSGVNAVNIQDGGNSITVDGTVAITQSVTADANNSSTTNLDVGNSYTFTGTYSSTLGVAGIQVSLFADKNCQIQVQQSPDHVNWDLTDTYHYTASGNFGITVQAISSYVRVVVTTNNETTTAFRLQTALCPTVEALPRSLDGNGSFKVATGRDEYGWQAENTPMGEARTVVPIRLVGAGFEGTTIDSRFWTTAAAGTSASIAQANAQITLTSGTSSGATVTMYSNRRSRYVSGTSMRYRAVMQVAAGKTNNKRRWGVGYGTSLPTITDGAWFQLDGTEFSIVTCKGTSQTKVTSFNGNLGATFAIGTGVRTYEIYWTNSKVWFVIGDEILHTVYASTDTWANTMGFHIFNDSLNADIIDTSVTLQCRTASIYRMGAYTTQPTYYNITGNAATHVLKLGAGILHKIIFNNTSGTSLQIVDNVTGTSPNIGTITTASAALGSWTYDVPFNTGLIIITVGNSLDATVVYE